MNVHAIPVHPWQPDQGDGAYRNPVLPLDYSDPDVIRVGGDYWMTASSFTATPGLPILHSRDLVNWRLAGHAIRQVPHPSYRAVRPGNGVWAPSLRQHDGRFWIFFPMPEEGIYATSAAAMDGPWEEPWLVQQARGWIDPCPFWDDDGRAWLFHAFAKSRAGVCDRIHIRPMAPDGRRLLGEGWEMVHAPHHPYLEGPKVHKRDGWYWVMAPGGGVPQGWQVAFRARSLAGPWEEKVVLAQGNTPVNGPHQGAFVDTPDGTWWFLHFQDTGPFGRILHLQPVDWPAGGEWPRVGGGVDPSRPGEPVTGARNALLAADGRRPFPEGDDEFTGTPLRLFWQWQANHDPAWADLSSRPGWLRLRAQPPHPGKFDHNPHLLLQKFPARAFTASTLMETPPAVAVQPLQAGLCVTGGGRSASLAVHAGGGRPRLVLKGDGIERTELPAPAGPVRLAVAVEPDGACRFGHAAGGTGLTCFPQAFIAREGGWMGAKVGLFAHGAAGAYSDFDYFRFGPPTSRAR